MKQLSLLFILFALVPNLSHAAKGDKAKWYKCKKDSECILTNNQCGWPVAINNDELFDYQKRENDPKVICDAYNGPGFDQLRPLCKKHKCTFIVKKPKPGSKK